MQILIDENSVVLAAAKVGGFKGGIDVKSIPKEVLSCPMAWKFDGGEFTENENYTPPTVTENHSHITVEDLALAVAELAEIIAGGEENG